MINTSREFIVEHWERAIFCFVGLIFLVASINLLLQTNVPYAAASVGIAVLCFLYGNASRFKRFKGFGIEAEMWEETKKEAEDLISRLKTVIEIYSTEILLHAVTKNRFESGSNWPHILQLYQDLSNQHDVLGHDIDISKIKTTIEDYFLLDICTESCTQIRHKIIMGKEKAMGSLDHSRQDEEGATIYRSKRKSIQSISPEPEDWLLLSSNNTLADEAIRVWQSAKERLMAEHQVEIEIDQRYLDRLHFASTLYKKRPLDITPDLLPLADRDSLLTG